MTAGDAAFVHLRALQAIADRNGGNRALGTPGYDRSVDYLADTLRRAGFRVETPEFPIVIGGDSDTEEESGSRPAGGTTRNVIAQTTTGRPEEVVLAGAHLDSVPVGPGIDDNGSGAAALLEIALKLGSAPPVANSVRFVWFGAEEEGLLGSQHYLRTLSAEQRRDIALMLNADVIAAPNAGYFVYDGDNSNGGGTTGPPGSAAIEKILADHLASLGARPAGFPFIDDSDYGPFVNAGIATGGVFSGDSGIKTPEQAATWGGRPGVPYDPCYHRACDTVANIDRVALDRMLDTLAFGIGSFATDLGGVPSRNQRTTG
ncbi:M28 family peptidase [Actinomycetospora atypica]|uniref:M28 family peptidase n=1 Tax=Actinomycetospora atypica TaxID=1290095 RepID=A0ABV9YQI1_9PSEU